MTIHPIIRRVFMTVLFLLAVYATFQFFSGVKASAVEKVRYLDFQEKTSGIENNQETIGYKKTGLSLKRVHYVRKNKVFVSPSIAVPHNTPSLETAINWSAYPKKQVVATGYTAGVESTGKYPGSPQYGITYSGVKVKRDLYSTIAADTKVFPIGTILFIPNYGYGVVADTGSAIKGNRLDLYYETVADVYRLWGKKSLNVYIVHVGDGKLTEKTLKDLNENKTMQVFRQQYIKGNKQ